MQRSHVSLVSASDEANNAANAVAILHAPDVSPDAKLSVELWLQNWCMSPSAWRTCLLLLNQPTLFLATDKKRAYFAGCLHSACQQSSGDVPDPLLQPSLVLEPTALLLLKAVPNPASEAEAKHLAAAMASIAIRSVGWDPASIIFDISKMLSRAAVAADPTRASGPGSVWALTALLLVLQSMA